MLNRREKRRYVAVMYNESNLYRPFQLHELIVRRFEELFGALHCEMAMLRRYDSDFENILLLGCKLDYLDLFLVSLSLTQPSLVVVRLSGTLKKLRKNVSSLQIRKIKNIRN